MFSIGFEWLVLHISTLDSRCLTLISPPPFKTLDFGRKKSRI